MSPLLPLKLQFYLQSSSPLNLKLNQSKKDTAVDRAGVATTSVEAVTIGKMMMIIAREKVAPGIRQHHPDQWPGHRIDRNEAGEMNQSHHWQHHLTNITSGTRMARKWIIKVNFRLLFSFFLTCFT